MIKIEDGYLFSRCVLYTDSTRSKKEKKKGIVGDIWKKYFERLDTKGNVPIHWDMTLVGRIYATYSTKEEWENVGGYLERDVWSLKFFRRRIYLFFFLFVCHLEEEIFVFLGYGLDDTTGYWRLGLGG